MGILSSHAMTIEFRPDVAEFRTSNPEHALNYWKFQVGDSPLDPNTHEPVWARPISSRFGMGAGEPQLVPRCWQYGVYPWLVRKRARWVLGICLVPRPSEFDSPPYPQELALAGPDRVDDAFQVFLNGRLLGGLGDFNEITPTLYYNQPTRFRFTPPQRGQLTSYPVVIAFRIWMGPNSLFHTYQVGGLRSTPFLGTESAVELHYQQSWRNLTRSRLPHMACAISFLAPAIVAS